MMDLESKNGVSLSLSMMMKMAYLHDMEWMR